MAITSVVYGNKQPKDMTDQELHDQIIGLQNMVKNTTGNSEKYGYTSGALYNRLATQMQEEVNKRENDKAIASQKSELESILGGVGGGGISGGIPSSGYDIGALERDARSGADTQRKALEDIFSAGKTSGTNAINEVFANQRGQAIDELSAMGGLRQPGLVSKSLADVDARKSNSLRDLFLGLEGQRAQGRLGVESDIAGRLERGREFGANLGQNESQFGRNLEQNRRQNLASMLQGGGQFQQTFGLEQNKFSNQKQRQSIDDIFNRQALDQADRLGRMQADAAKPTFLDQFAQVTGGIGNLAGGIGSLTRPKRRTAGVN